MNSIREANQTKDTTTQLGTDAIWRLIARFSIPAIISMSVAAVYNIVDRIFIGQYVGEAALGGLMVAFPLMMILFAVGALFTVGGSALIAIKFGEQKQNEAQAVFGNMITLILFFCLSFIIAGFVFITPLLKLMGATEGILPYARGYMRIILIGLTFQLPSFAMSFLARTEGKPRLSMISQIVSGVANIILDYCFIALLGWGVEGAALATIAGQFIGFVMLFWYFFISGKSILRFRWKNLSLRYDMVKAICAIGASGFFMQVGNSVSGAMFLTALGTYGGDGAISSMSAVNSLLTLALMPILGLQQGLGPIIGYNHGMRRSDRVRLTLLLGMAIGGVISVLVFALVQIWPVACAALFIDPESPTMRMCVHAIRVCFIMLPFLPVNVISTAYFQSTAQSLKAFVLSISRAVIFMIPCVLILPSLFQLEGVWFSLPISDFFAIILAVTLLVHSISTLKPKKDPAAAPPLKAAPATSKK